MKFQPRWELQIFSMNSEQNSLLWQQPWDLRFVNFIQLCSNMHFLLKIHFSPSHPQEWQNLIKISFLCRLPFCRFTQWRNLWLTVMTSYFSDFLSFPVKQSAVGRDYDIIVSSNYSRLFTQWATELWNAE